MRMRDIKVDDWYETSFGTGYCTEAAKRHPQAAKIWIMHPYPRGEVYVKPKDIIRKVEAEPPVRDKNQADLEEKS